MLVEGLAADSAHPLEPDGAVSIDHKGTGKVKRLKGLLGGNIGRVEPDGKGQFVILDKLQDIGCAVAIIDGNDHKAVFFMLFVKGL